MHNRWRSDPRHGNGRFLSRAVQDTWERPASALYAPEGREILGLDVLDSPFTSHVGSIVDRLTVRECMRGTESVLHTATLHKPHVETHGRDAFIETNVTGTMILLEEAVAAAGVTRFVFTSTTSAFGRALVPSLGSPAAWITEGCCPDTEKYLWRNQDSGRGSVCIGGSGGGPPGGGLAYITLLPGSR